MLAGVQELQIRVLTNSLTTNVNTMGKSVFVVQRSTSYSQFSYKISMRQKVEFISHRA